MNIVKSLQAVTSYPVPRAVAENICDCEELKAEAEATKDVRKSKPYKRALASVYKFLSSAPNVSQAGISYSLTDADKTEYRKMADRLFREAGDEADAGAEFGYVGDNF